MISTSSWGLGKHIQFSGGGGVVGGISTFSREEERGGTEKVISPFFQRGFGATLIFAGCFLLLQTLSEVLRPPHGNFRHFF